MTRYNIDSLDNRDARYVAKMVKTLGAYASSYFRGEVRGLERVPEGAALFVGNHNAGLLLPEALLLGTALYHKLGLDSVPYGLAHEVAISVPGLHELVVPMGAVRASHANAIGLFARGAKVLVYPGGDIEAMRSWRDRNRILFGGRRGYIRLALRAGVPIVPVVAAGAHETFLILDDGRWLAKLLGAKRWLRVNAWPITLSVPWGITVGPGLLYWPWPTKILVETLAPIHFDRTGDEAADDEAYVRACSEQVESTMQTALTRLAKERAAAA
jgi:1-acyl-sn-glycerol-3-phosphate acyltransferase